MQDVICLTGKLAYIQCLETCNSCGSQSSIPLIATYQATTQRPTTRRPITRKPTNPSPMAKKPTTICTTELACNLTLWPRMRKPNIMPLAHVVTTPLQVIILNNPANLTIGAYYYPWYGANFHKGTSYLQKEF
jgi:hypothetical protein